MTHLKIDFFVINKHLPNESIGSFVDFRSYSILHDVYFEMMLIFKVKRTINQLKGVKQKRGDENGDDYFKGGLWVQLFFFFLPRNSSLSHYIVCSGKKENIY